jgi:hypothetical protein
MSTTTYIPPVDKLLTLGKAEPVISDNWPNYLELGIGPEHIPDLIRRQQIMKYAVSNPKKEKKRTPNSGDPFMPYVPSDNFTLKQPLSH